MAACLGLRLSFLSSLADLVRGLLSLAELFRVFNLWVNDFRRLFLSLVTTLIIEPLDASYDS